MKVDTTLGRKDQEQTCACTTVRPHSISSHVLFIHFFHRQIVLIASRMFDHIRMTRTACDCRYFWFTINHKLASKFTSETSSNKIHCHRHDDRSLNMVSDVRLCLSLRNSWIDAIRFPNFIYIYRYVAMPPSLVQYFVLLLCSALLCACPLSARYSVY